MKNNQGAAQKELRAKLGPVCFATLMALGMVQNASAAITADTSAAHQPGIQKNSNGATVIDINKASSQGVSHNIYTEFNVDKNGVVLNNSTTNTNTQLAGNISGNANLAGNSATIILNEVRSSDPSQLNGMVEVAGKSAQVIIANPSGITCDGCGFINTNHATLTTGTANFTDGKLTGYDVKKGQVVITGAGMDVDNNGKPQLTDIFARSVKVNAKLQANNLNIVTGANRLKMNGDLDKYIAGTGDAPQLALDVTSLGSMYAGKINMLGTEAGVGVRLDNADIVSTGRLSLSTNGKLENNGSRIVSMSEMGINADSLDNSNGIIHAERGNLNVNISHDLNNHNGKITSENIYLNGGHTNNTNGLIDAKQQMNLGGQTLDNTEGEIHSGSDMWVSYNYNERADLSESAINNEKGVISSGGNMTVQSLKINNHAGLIHSDGALSIDAHNLVNTDSDAFVANDKWQHQYQAQGGIYAGNAATSPYAHYAPSQSVINAKNLNNENGRIISSGDQTALQIYGYDSLNNNNGVIDSAASLAVSYANAINNGTGKINAAKDLSLESAVFNSDAEGKIAAGNNVNIRTYEHFDNKGEIIANNNLSLDMSIAHRYPSGESRNEGNMSAGGEMTLQTQSGDFVNAGTMDADNGLTWYGNNVTNQGRISSKNAINFYVSKLTNAKDATITGESVGATGEVDNQGTITPDFVPAGGGNTPVPNPDDNGSHVPDNGGYTPMPEPMPTPDRPDYHVPVTQDNDHYTAYSHH